MTLGTSKTSRIVETHANTNSGLDAEAEVLAAPLGSLLANSDLGQSRGKTEENDVLRRRPLAISHQYQN